MKNMDHKTQHSPSNFDLKGGPVEGQGTRINGMQQVVDLLKHADPAFRESLLKRLGQRDPQLVQNLRKIIR